METLMSNKFIFTPLPVLLSRTLELTNVTKIAIDILPVHSLISKKMAGTNMLIFLGDPRATHTVVFWMLGGLGFAQWDQLIYPLIILVFCGAWLWSQTTVLNAMTVGDETAATLGIKVAQFRLQVFFV